MNPNLYNAWLTAGNNLQPAGDWFVDFMLTVGPGLCLAIAAWLALWAWDWAVPRLTARQRRRSEIRQLKRIYKQPSTHPAHRTRKEDR